MNITWAKALLEVLTKLGVQHVCIGSGSRSTPLAVALAENPDIETTVHYDERGLGFHALGIAKSSKQPAAIIVTSGTAVGNLFPALMEAYYDRVPLIIISADRPHELRGCGANQAPDQVKIFGHYAHYVDLPCPDHAFPLGKTLAYALSLKMPMHINCPFKEPLLSFTKKPFQTEITEYAPTVSLPSMQEWAHRLSAQKEGCIVVGDLHTGENPTAIFSLAKKLGWSVYADINSNIRGHGPCLRSLPPRAEAILHLGGRLVAKTWPTAPFYCLVTDHNEPLDPSRRLTHRITCDPIQFCEALLSLIAGEKECPTASVKDWKPFFEAQPAINEPGIIFSLNELLPPSWSLFIGNSMPIRDVNNFLFPERPLGPIFTNRGLSGIDGNIATALGIAKGTQKPTLAIIGDLTFLHDINSLPLLKNSLYPLIILVINNGGAGIFSFLPIAEKQEVLEDYVAAAHEIHFEAAARLFKLPYHHPKTKEEWHTTFSLCLERNQSCIIELTTNRAENKALHDEISRLSSSTDFWAPDKIGTGSLST